MQCQVLCKQTAKLAAWEEWKVTLNPVPRTKTFLASHRMHSFAVKIHKTNLIKKEGIQGIKIRLNISC